MMAEVIPDKYAMERIGHATTMPKTVYQHLMEDKRREVDAAINERLHKLFA